ncbi:MAG: helix-turn-helix transcriptional regulator [Actinomycetota bacterium]|nr:helix-turn-helix transcriptional regulator [Actinomycetota bacterium]
MDEHDDRPVYVISVAAELSGMHPQTLRQYDRLGLVTPGRSSGRGRRYSPRDVALLRQVAQLSGEGLGLEGIRRVLALQQEVRSLRDEVDRLRAELDSAQKASARQEAMLHARLEKQYRRDLVPLERGAVVVWRPERERGPR